MGKCYSKPTTVGAKAIASLSENTIEFVPPFTNGQVIKVYDGDTITIAARLPNDAHSPLYRVHVRLLGVDAPEMKSQNESERHTASQAQRALSDLIMGKTIVLRNTQNEKYGRLLADVYCDGVHVNAWLLEQRWAVPYDGGTKKHVDDWTTFHESKTE